MDSPFIALMVIGCVVSVVASMLTVTIARRWLAFSLDTLAFELRIAVIAGVLQGILSPIILAGGLLGVFSIGLFPIWAVFSLAHRDQWERFDGIKFSALQAVFTLVIAMPLTIPVFR